MTLADVDADAVGTLAARLGAKIIPAADIHAADVDVIAPCALGGVLSAKSIPEIKAKLVIGAANNQWATPEDDARLTARGIVYCPDYLANPGGNIDLHYQLSEWSRGTVDAHVT